jgi:VIT1/CCC1 family predicted Fe2+/Mn2+ transporter
MFNKLNSSIKTGISFGLTSGTITTLGLMIGLSAATSSKAVVIGGIITIAVADAFSDALGIHISEESKSSDSKKIWQATAATFLTKIIYTLTYLIPVLLFQLQTGIYVAVGWGLFVISWLSYIIAKSQKEKPAHVIFEHLVITIVVILITHYLGIWISNIFG